MKNRILALLLVLVMVACMFVACGDEPAPTPDGSDENGALTHEQFLAAEVGSTCTIEAYVQAWQGWWNNQITLYLQDRDGGYFVYNASCTQENANKLTKGCKIRVTGEKTDYNGMIEIYGTDGAATFEFVEGGDTFIATATDVTALYNNTQELVAHQNEFVAVKGLTVQSVSFKNAETAEEASDDIYIVVKLGDNNHDLCIEVYLTGTSTDVYGVAKTLAAGDVIDIEGFLYWYNNADNIHVTGITKAAQ